jgi:hypothetical protein
MLPAKGVFFAETAKTEPVRAGPKNYRKEGIISLLNAMLSKEEFKKR